MKRNIALIALLAIAGCANPSHQSHSSQPPAATTPTTHAQLHARMQSMRDTYAARGITQFDQWSAADQATFEDLLHQYTAQQ